jgi:hypothetical protein
LVLREHAQKFFTTSKYVVYYRYIKEMNAVSKYRLKYSDYYEIVYQTGISSSRKPALFKDEQYEPYVILTPKGGVA